jgi:hypothetical protein
MNNFGQFLAGTSTQVPSILSSTDSSDDSDNTDFPPILSDVYLKVASAFFLKSTLSKKTTLMLSPNILIVTFGGILGAHDLLLN